MTTTTATTNKERKLPECRLDWIQRRVKSKVTHAGRHEVLSFRVNSACYLTTLHAPVKARISTVVARAKNNIPVLSFELAGA